MAISQANTGRGRANHLLALQLAFENRIDVVCIQEPWIHRDYERRFTCSHPGYETHIALDSWETTRPRTATYVRKGAGLTADQLRPFGPHSDIVVLTVNGITIYNVYNDGQDCTAVLEILDTDTFPQQRTILLGDFNLRSRKWEPSLRGPASSHARAFEQWLEHNNLILLNELDIPTHNRGHVLDLAFSTPDLFGQGITTTIEEALTSTSDHSTLLTLLPGTQREPEGTGRLLAHKVDPEAFSNRLGDHPYTLAPVHPLESTDSLDAETERLTAAVSTILQVLVPRKSRTARGNP